METKIYNRSNFHKHTFCIFTEVEIGAIGNSKPDFTSKSGSSYYFTETGVYRRSNHWSRVANCRWRLEGNVSNASRTKLGFALWSSFHRDNDFEKLYFITVDYQNKTASYNHKATAENTCVFLRNASETSKTIKQIRNLFETGSWAKYLEGDIEILRKKIIEKLRTTDLPLNEIRRFL